MAASVACPLDYLASRLEGGGAALVLFDNALVSSPEAVLGSRSFGPYGIVSAVLTNATALAERVALGPVAIAPFGASTPANERDALTALYDTLNGVKWRFPSAASAVNGLPWGRDDVSSDPCWAHWYGVVCDPSGAIAQILLGELELIGELPAVLGELSGLRVLTMSQNKLSGVLPDTLSGLTALQSLDLSANLIEGGIEPLAGLEDLVILDMSDNQLSGDFAEYSLPPALTNVRLSANAMTGTLPPTLAVPELLVELLLTGNQLEGTVPSTFVNSLTAIEQLDVGGNRLVGVFPSPTATPALFSLTISANAFTAVGSLEPLRNVLQSFRACCNELTEVPEMHAFPATTYLDLSANRLRGVLNVTRLPRSDVFYTLILSDNELTDVAPEFADWYLWFLDLSGNLFADTSLLSRLPPSVGSLLLSRNRIAHEYPLLSFSLFARFYDIERLHLDHNQLSGVLLLTAPEARGRVWLHEIDLSYNNISGPVPELFSEMRSLRTLDLRGNPHMARDVAPGPLIPGFVEADFRSADTAALSFAACPQFVSPSGMVSLQIDHSYHGYRMCVCLDGSYNSSGICLPCLQHSVCVGYPSATVSTLTAAKGYYAIARQVPVPSPYGGGDLEAIVPSAVVACQYGSMTVTNPRNPCNENSNRTAFACAQGHYGRMCSACKSGYLLRAGRCVACTSSEAAYPLLFIMTFVVVLAATVGVVLARDTMPIVDRLLLPAFTGEPGQPPRPAPLTLPGTTDPLSITSYLSAAIAGVMRERDGQPLAEVLGAGASSASVGTATPQGDESLVGFTVTSTPGLGASPIVSRSVSVVGGGPLAVVAPAGTPTAEPATRGGRRNVQVRRTGRADESGGGGGDVSLAAVTAVAAADEGRSPLAKSPRGMSKSMTRLRDSNGVPLPPVSPQPQSQQGQQGQQQQQHVVLQGREMHGMSATLTGALPTAAPAAAGSNRRRSGMGRGHRLGPEAEQQDETLLSEQQSEDEASVFEADDAGSSGSTSSSRAHSARPGATVNLAPPRPRITQSRSLTRLHSAFTAQDVIEAVRRRTELQQGESAANLSSAHGASAGSAAAGSQATSAAANPSTASLDAGSVTVHLRDYGDEDVRAEQLRAKRRALKQYLQSLVQVVINLLQTLVTVLQNAVLPEAVLPLFQVFSLFSVRADSAGIGLECLSQFRSARAHLLVTVLLPVIVVVAVLGMFAVKFAATYRRARLAFAERRATALERLASFAVREHALDAAGGLHMEHIRAAVQAAQVSAAHRSSPEDLERENRPALLALVELIVPEDGASVLLYHCAYLTMLVLNFFLMPLSTYSFSLFNCAVDPVSRVSFFVAQPNVRCDTIAWWEKWLTLLAYVGLPLFGLVAAMVYVERHPKTYLGNTSFTFWFQALRSRQRPFALLFMVRRLGLSLLVTFLAAHSLAQTVVVAAVLLLSVILVVSFRPYYYPAVNRADGAGHALILVAFIATASSDGTTASATTSAASPAQMRSAVIVYGLVALVLLLSAILFVALPVIRVLQRKLHLDQPERDAAARESHVVHRMWHNLGMHPLHCDFA